MLTGRVRSNTDVLDLFLLILNATYCSVQTALLSEGHTQWLNYRDHLFQPGTTVDRAAVQTGRL